MNDYAFFIAQLRFVANRTERESDDVSRMMDDLHAIADAIEADGDHFFVAASALRSSARALAGVAGFMQQHILPEVVVSGNAAGEKQIRWTIDTCMTLMAELMTHAELIGDGEGLSLTLPPPG